jgi:hypothetical protein
MWRAEIEITRKELMGQERASGNFSLKITWPGREEGDDCALMRRQR